MILLDQNGLFFARLRTGCRDGPPLSQPVLAQRPLFDQVGYWVTRLRWGDLISLVGRERRCRFGGTSAFRLLHGQLHLLLTINVYHLL